MRVDNSVTNVLLKQKLVHSEYWGLTECSLVFFRQHMEVFKVQCLCTPPILFSSGVAAGSLSLLMTDPLLHWVNPMRIFTKMSWRTCTFKISLISATILWQYLKPCPLHTYRANIYVKHIRCDHRLILCGLCAPCVRQSAPPHTAVSPTDGRS